jgi:aspartate aminotransferase-like enzyme
MLTYDIPLVPGPVTVLPEVAAAYQVNYGSADLEPEFRELYAGVQAQLQRILATTHTVALMSGEGMAALWGALKSTVRPGDRVLAVATGVFGYGIADMARALGAEVETVAFAHDEAAGDLGRIEAAIRRFRPRLLSLVHCETPSGILNPAQTVGDLVRAHRVPLYYVDAVASLGGGPVQVDAWGIDLCLGASQKVLGSLADLAFVAVSPKGWEAVREVGYAGYDALAPFQTALETGMFPHTPNWAAVDALHRACGRLLEEGLEAVFRRHADVAAFCRERLAGLGLELFPRDPAVSAPTVTAVKVPETIGWPVLDAALRRRGMVVGGSYGPLAGRVFRIGHMGPQADRGLVAQGMDVLAEALEESGRPGM